MIALFAALSLAHPSVASLAHSSVAPLPASEQPAVQAAPAQSSTLPRSMRDALGPLFTRANADPSGVVPLILQASALLDGTLDGEGSGDGGSGRLAGGSSSSRAPSAEDARLLADTLEPYCRRLFFSPERFPGMQKLGLLAHVVKSGEVPERIVKRYKIGAGLLEYLNKDFDAKKLHEGQELKVLDLSSGLEVDIAKGMYRLGAWRRLENGRRVLVEYVPVGLGAAESPTPEGRTSITLRARDPDWTDPTTKQVYKAGDPRNVLGGYWMALDAAGLGKSGIGLHGFTGDAPANWIEQPASHGCVRMLQGDIDRLFSLAIEGTPVLIRP